MLNLDELNQVGEPHARSSNIKTYELLLEQCHKKIKEYNNVYRSKCCYYKPPVFLISKPIYNYYDLLQYLVDNLTSNGLVANITDNHGIFICWDPVVLNAKRELFTPFTISSSSTMIPSTSTMSNKNKQFNSNSNSNLKNGGQCQANGVKNTTKNTNKPTNKNVKKSKTPEADTVDMIIMENDEFPVNLGFKRGSH